MRLALALIVLVACAPAVIASAPTAAACACGEIHGPLVARGVSPGGVPWQIRIHHPGPEVDVDFSYLPPADSIAGYGVGFPFAQVAHSLVFSANAGEDLGPAREQDVSGVASRRITEVVIALADGSRLVVRPRLARPAAYLRHPWLRRLRFYDAFLPRGPAPRMAIGRDERGRMVAREPLD